MSDPTATALIKSGVAAAALDLMGVSPSWLVAAFFGALALQAFGQITISRARAMVQIACSSVLGALIGGALAHMGGVQVDVVRLLLCALGGFGTYPLMQALVERVQSKVKGDSHAE